MSIQKTTTKRSSYLQVFTDKFYKTFKKRADTSFSQTSKKQKREHSEFTQWGEYNLIPKPNKTSHKKATDNISRI